MPSTTTRKGINLALPAIPQSKELAPKQAVALERKVAASVAKVENLDEAVEWLSQADALAAYLSHHDAQGPMLGAMRRIEARIGELIAAEKGGRGKVLSREKVSIDKSQLTQFRKLAQAVKEGVLIYEDDGDETPWRTSRRTLLASVKDKVRGSKRKQRETKLRAETKAKEEAAQAEIEAADVPPYELHVGDLDAWLPTMRPDSIITDPPYVGDSIPLYEKLRDFAIDTLPEGGPLVVMTWQAILPEVIEALRCPELSYRWTICWRYANTENTVDHPRRVFDCWKPILVYHWGGMPDDAPMIRDEIANAVTDKSVHEWGQSVEGFERLVLSFSQPGDVVCDPFLGGGTTAIAALANTRRFAGCDIDPAAIEITERRLQIEREAL